MNCEQFPFELTVRVTDLATPVTWRVETELPDGPRVRTKPAGLPSSLSVLQRTARL